MNWRLLVIIIIKGRQVFPVAAVSGREAVGLKGSNGAGLSACVWSGGRIIDR